MSNGCSAYRCLTCLKSKMFASVDRSCPHTSNAAVNDMMLKHCGRHNIATLYLQADLFAGAVFLKLALGWSLYSAIILLLAIAALFAILGKRRDIGPIRSSTKTVAPRIG